MKELLNQELAYGTVALNLTVLRWFFQGLIERDYISYNLAQGVSPPRGSAPDDNIKPLATEEVERFFAQIRKARGISCHALRHTCEMKIIRQTGIVKAVQLALHHEDISTSGKYAHLANKKTARYSERSQLSI